MTASDAASPACRRRCTRAPPGSAARYEVGLAFTAIPPDAGDRLQAVLVPDEG